MLPKALFFNTGIPACLWFLRRGKKKSIEHRWMKHRFWIKKLLNNYEILIDQIVKTNVGFQQHTAKSIDKFLTFRNWLIGAYIMEYEQNGADKAEYGSKLDEKIAKRLNTKGLSTRNLKLFKQFYNTYPQIMQTVSALLETSNLETMQSVSALLPKHKDVEYYISPESLINNLSFSHFVELLKISDENKRLFYEV